jgi:hypothetical protein
VGAPLVHSVRRCAKRATGFAVNQPLILCDPNTYFVTRKLGQSIEGVNMEID